MPDLVRRAASRPWNAIASGLSPIEAKRAVWMRTDGKNNGPFKDEPVTTKDEADVIWVYNMMTELGVFQHNMATCAPTIWGDVLFICTSNGVDNSHLSIPAPDVPSFIALHKRTGQLLWKDNSPGKNILHGQWSCPVVGIFDEVPQVIFPGGDGWIYSFRADRWNILEINIRNSTYTVRVVANNVLYIANRTHIFAIESKEDVKP